MQPSEYEIQREVEALRDLRRRSTSQGGPGALILDPDLPNPTSPTSPSAGYWSSARDTPALTDGDSSSSSHDDAASDRSSTSDDPFHLFWVPASLHPEIAPAEFRAFLKEHAHAVPGDGATSPERSNSTASIGSYSGLGRKKSMLSRQYSPAPHDGVENEKVVPLRRNRTSAFANAGPQLTISDLQRLEELAEEASTSDDPSKLRSVLRRSLSLNVSPSVIDKMDDMPDMEDDADSPIIVPRPGQILRRAARTKIRKPGLPGDGGGHRFGASTRRGPGARAGTAPPETRTSSDLSSNDHDSVDAPTQRGRSFSNEAIKDGIEGSMRPESFSEEALIYDSYMREEPDEEESVAPVLAVTSPPEPLNIELPLSPPPPQEEQPFVLPVPIEEPAPAPVLHHPQPQRLLSPPSAQAQLSRTPSPESESSHPSASDPALSTRPASDEPPAFLSTTPSPHRKEKDKKGLFGKWGSDKGGKRSSKEKEKEREGRERAEKEKEREREKEKEKEKEKEGGFFGSLFGSKKKQDDSQTLGHSSTGRETAAALLGASKSRSHTPSVSPAFGNLDGSYARYPIHVERAIYRLSHIKLANPRRPLYEQVLISNLMFWYLGVINKTQPTPTTPPASSTTPPTEKEKKEAEQKAREDQAKAELERLENLAKEQQRMAEQQRKESGRRGSLTKGAQSGNGGGRRAEMPVRGPQYEMQHRVMEQEYGYGGQSSKQGYSSPSQRPGPAPAQGQGAKVYQPQPQSSIPNNFYYGVDGVQKSNGSESQHPPSAQLPPGAMRPVAVDQKNAWQSQNPPRNHSSPSPPPQASSPPTGGYSGPRRSRSPPPPQHNRAPPTHEKHHQGASGRPGRSLSATAAAPPPNHAQAAAQNGRLRKGSSAHAAAPSPAAPRARVSGGGRISGDEDVPLALWQQQRRK
ncbi:hypothetical protein PLICRDRAFT_43054 [Plicaturopsis crispa FD-325 SS-3]|nr:hypothetical protein PLICRDRAFT_43054 [Plicaturopsis crispa FD-325 SS-3]